MAAGIFRKAWFPRLKPKIGLAPLNSTSTLIGVQATNQFANFGAGIILLPGMTGQSATASVGSLASANQIHLTGQAATTAIGTVAISVSKNVNLLGQSVATQLGSFVTVIDGDRNLTGVQATATFGSFIVATNRTLSGVQATTAVGTFNLITNRTLSGVQAITSVGAFIAGVDRHQNLTGVSATTGVGSFNFVNNTALRGQHAVAEIGKFANELAKPSGLQVQTQVPSGFFQNKNVNLHGLQVLAIAFSAAGAGGGGGGSAGLYGPGQNGFSGAATGEGGRGGDADNHLVIGAIISGTAGTSGVEISPSPPVGSGSGGAGAAFQTGASLTTYNYNGTVFLSYISTVSNTLKFVTLTTADNASSPFRIPNDWSNSNVVSLTGSGCTNHGETALFSNVINFNAGDFVAFFCSSYCSELQTSFGSYSASSGVNAPIINGNIGGDGGLYGGGGGGGTGGGGGRGGDGVIYIQYRSSFDHLIHTIVFHMADNGSTPWHVPTDWTDSNFVYLQGSGGCGATGSPRQGGDGGGGAGVTGGFDTSAFNPGDVVPFFVSPGCSGLPTILGPFAARSGLNGGESPESGFGLLDHFQIVLPCGGSTGDGTVGPTRPPSSILVE